MYSLFYHSRHVYVVIMYIICRVAFMYMLHVMFASLSYFSFNLNELVYLLSPSLSVGSSFGERFIRAVQIFLPEKLERFE